MIVCARTAASETEGYRGARRHRTRGHDHCLKFEQLLL